jgi:transcription elongation factor GreA
MNEKTTFLTPEGRKKLEEELYFLKNTKRHEVADAIHSAKEEGDIMENSAYDAAKEQQAFVEGRINTIESMLKNAVLINEDTLEKDTVTLGCFVKLHERGQSVEEEYQIVGSAEADPSKGRISNESPVGKALMNKRAGDEVIVKIPAGERKLKILGIR